MIYKSKHLRQDNFTVIPNDIFETLTNTTSLAILCYLLSKPDDWTTYKQQIYKRFDDGRERIDKAWKILEDKGYVVGSQKIDENSKFSGYQWIVYDTTLEQRIDGNTIDGNTIDGKRTIEKPTTNKKEYTKKEYTKKENKKENIKRKVFVPPSLEEFSNYAKQQRPNINLQDVKDKYFAWKENDWKDGYDTPIKNWKSKLNNSFKFMRETKKNQVGF